MTGKTTPQHAGTRPASRAAGQEGATVSSQRAPGTVKWWPGPVPGPEDCHPALDTSVAHTARVYDYWLGGKDNFAADREAAQQAIAVCPDIVFSVHANRAFLARAVRFLAAEAGIRQFLDIGTGITTASNTHEVAQSVAPDSRVVYVDNDPVVVAHARALLVGGFEGATTHLQADLRDPGRILAEAADVLDFTRPVAVLLLAILQHIHDADDPYQVVATLMGAVPAGSYLVTSHPARDIVADQMAQMAELLNQLMAEKVTFRDHAEVARFFEGLEIVHPGLVQAQHWRPDAEGEATSPAVLWAGVARKR
jgi:S-adenosyl methyltransferase